MKAERELQAIPGRRSLFRPEALLDRGAIRRLRRRSIVALIPASENQPRQPSFDHEVYRQRNQVERPIDRLKQFRYIATRYKKRACNYRVMLTIAMILLWF